MKYSTTTPNAVEVQESRHRAATDGALMAEANTSPYFKRTISFRMVLNLFFIFPFRLPNFTSLVVVRAMRVTWTFPNGMVQFSNTLKFAQFYDTVNEMYLLKLLVNTWRACMIRASRNPTLESNFSSMHENCGNFWLVSDSAVKMLCCLQFTSLSQFCLSYCFISCFIMTASEKHCCTNCFFFRFCMEWKRQSW